MRHWRTTRALPLLLAIGMVGCAPSDGSTVSPNPTAGASASVSASPSASASETEGVLVLAAGDIAACDSEGDELTAALLDGLEGAILALGDLAYESGTAAQFAACYDPSWGRHRSRTWPVPGNHEYETAGAAPYFAYFGAAAGAPGQGWYSFDLGAWHLIALNSNCDEIGGCDLDSPQADWLRADLATNTATCTLVYWHHPRWSSGSEHGSDPRTDGLWRILAVAGAELVPTGHDHVYERFVPMDGEGAAATDGMVEFVVGTGDSWAVDPDSEWFPALAHRVSVATVQGSEWLGQTAFRAQLNAHGELQDCAEDGSAECVRAWLADRPADYVFIPQGHRHGPNSPPDCCADLRANMMADPGFTLVYDGPGATILSVNDRLAEP